MNILGGLAKATIGRALGPQGPTLLFSINDKCQFQLENSIWTLYNGTRKDDKSEVLVFVCDLKANPGCTSLARNCLKRFKTIRFPDALKFLDGAESESQVIIGTEFGKPLSLFLYDKMNENTVALGLYRLATTLKFLSEDGKIIHGNINPNSIFVTKSGEWKLGGFELACPFGENQLKTFGSLINGRYIPPESDPSDATNGYPIHAYDAWAYGCLIDTIFNGKSNQMSFKQGTVPSQLYSYSKGFLIQNPTSRLDFVRFLSFCTRVGGYFDSPIIHTSIFIENFALKEKEEKEHFLSSIQSSLEQFPIEYCKFKILPELWNALEYSGASTNALVPILSMTSRLSKEEAQVLIIPSLVKMFSNGDRAIRLALCQQIDCYVEHLTPKMANDTIYPHLQTGFTDLAPIIRESTLKAVATLAPKLAPKTINTSLLQNLTKLQNDPEPGIRTNTIICLAKLNSYFDETEKRRSLLQAFVKSLRDPFEFARKASLMGLLVSISAFNAEDIARVVLPNIMPLTVDPNKEVSDQAFTAIDAFMKQLKEMVKEVHESEVDGEGSGVKEKLSSPLGDGWANWAFSAVSSGIKGSSSNMSSSPTKVEKTAAESKTTLPEPLPRTSFTEPVVKPLVTPMNLKAQSNRQSEWGNGWADEDMLDFGSPPKQATSTISANSNTWNNNDKSSNAWNTSTNATDDWGDWGTSNKNTKNTNSGWDNDDWGT